MLLSYPLKINKVYAKVQDLLKILEIMPKQFEVG